MLSQDAGSPPPIRTDFLRGGASLPHAEPVAMYLAQLDGHSSKATMSGCLDRLARLIATGTAATPPHADPISAAQGTWWTLTYPDAVKIREHLAAQTSVNRFGETVTWSTSHVNKHLTALRQVLAECRKLGLMDADTYLACVAVKNIKGNSRKAGRGIPADERAAILYACRQDHSPAGVRDAALIAVLDCTGVRRDEAATLCREDYDRAERTLQVRGKGNRHRQVYINTDAAWYLNAWLILAERDRGPLFTPINKHGQLGSRNLSGSAIGKIVEKRREQAGLPTVTPHDFRRTLVGDLLDEGNDLVTVQKILGHATIVTTSRYDRRGEKAQKRAIDGRGLPSAAPLPPPSGH